MQRNLSRARAALEDQLSAAPPTVEETTQKIYTLNAISASISRETSLDRILEHALDWVLHVTGAESGTVFLYNEDVRELNLVASKGLSERFLAEHERIGYGSRLSGAVLRSALPLILDDMHEDPRVLPVALAEGI